MRSLFQKYHQLRSFLFLMGNLVEIARMIVGLHAANCRFNPGILRKNFAEILEIMLIKRLLNRQLILTHPLFIFILLIGCQARHTNQSVQEKMRETISLNGIWQIEDCISDSLMPTSFTHTVQVPGLVNLASPSFKDAGKFISRDVANHPLYKNPNLPEEARTAPVGISLQERNYFWYQKSFKAPEKRQVAILKINKAQFGTEVWLNGMKIGKHDGCFTAGFFNLTDVIKWDTENLLQVRVGAHPAVLPLTVPTGTDLEKFEWMPGIYDEVSISFAYNPVIERIQVAPRINSSEIVVQTVVKNYGNTPCIFQLTHHVKPWKEEEIAGHALSDNLKLDPGERRTLIQVIPINNPKLWTPEDPYLYIVESATGSDNVTTRFGMREFHFDRATGWAYLNNKPYFLRGANITLHRFFEDEKCGRLPWQEEWVRKLLIDVPKQMHWNSFRFCIGPVPDRWMDIADEAGLLIQNQFFIWVPNQDWGHQEWDLIPHFAEWIVDNCNHPSLAVWDACNESNYPALTEKVIPAVRPIDLSNRPWHSTPPLDSDDPIERHLYVLPENDSLHTFFDWTHFEKPPVYNRNNENKHPGVVNEYGEFWLNRDGSPTTLTNYRFKNFLAGPNATSEERFEAAAYYLAGETEYHRAYRIWAAVQHFTYLTCSFPGAYTSDNFRDVEKLELDPYFKDYMGEAFKPLGVNLSFWKPELRADSVQCFKVMLVNDYYESMKGNLSLSIEDGSGRELTAAEMSFSIPALGQKTYPINLRIPDIPGKCLIKARAIPGNGIGPTISRRKSTIRK